MTSRLAKKVSSPARRAVLWLNAEQEGIARRLCDRLNLQITGVGPAGRDGAALARSFDAELKDDIRNVVADSEIELIVVLSLDATTRSALSDAVTLAHLAQEGAPALFITEPFASSLLDVKRLRTAQPQWASHVQFLPRFLAAKGATAATASLESFGRCRSLDYASRCARHHSSLAARLCDAMEFVYAVLGEPESIDASLSGVESPSGLRLVAGDSLSDIAGDLNAHLRYSDGRAAAISLSDQAGAWFRGATLLGVGGCLRFDDRSFQWIDTKGAVLDESPTRESELVDVADLIADQIEAAPDRRSAMMPPDRIADSYALAEAALLSARTGQPESPTTIRKMIGMD